MQDDGSPPTDRPTAHGPRKVARDLAAQLVLRGISLALGVVAVALLARGLGLEGMGKWTALTTVLAILGEFTELGLEGLAVRRAAARPQDEARLVGTLLVLRALLVVPTFVAGAIAGLIIATDGDMRIAALVASAVVVTSVPAAMRTVFQLRLRNDVPQLVTVLNSVLWTGGLLLLVQVSVTALVYYALALMVVNGVTGVLQAVLAWRVMRPDFSHVRRMGGEMLRVGVVLGLGALIVGGYARIDQVLVLRLDGEEAAGVFGTAVSTVERIGVVPLTLMATMTPIMAAAAARGRADLRSTTLLATRLVAVAALGVIAVFAAASGPIVEVLYGAEFAAVAGVLPFVGVNFGLGMLGYVTTTLVLIHERQRRQLAVAVVGLLVNVPLNLLLIPLYGYWGAIGVATTTEVVVLALITWTIRSSLPATGAVAGVFARTLVAALVTALATAGLVRVGAPLVAVLAFAGVVYLVALALTGAVRRADVEALRGGRAAARA